MTPVFPLQLSDKTKEVCAECRYSAPVWLDPLEREVIDDKLLPRGANAGWYHMPARDRSSYKYAIGCGGSDIINAALRIGVVEPEKVIFKSGVTGSKIPRYDLIPQHSLTRLADRFALGVEKHKERAWNARTPNQGTALVDKEWLIARAAHAIDHAYKLIAKLSGVREDDGDDDAAAIMWAGSVLCEGTNALSKTPLKSFPGSEPGWVAFTLEAKNKEGLEQLLQTYLISVRNGHYDEFFKDLAEKEKS